MSRLFVFGLGILCGFVGTMLILGIIYSLIISKEDEKNDWLLKKSLV